MTKYMYIKEYLYDYSHLLKDMQFCHFLNRSTQIFLLDYSILTGIYTARI